jgi:YD repeat-containing protein
MTNNMGGTARTLSYLHDAFGNRVRLTWPDAQYVTFDYDGLSRMTAVKQSGTTTLATYTYNALALPATRTNGAAVSSFGFDGIGRMSSLNYRASLELPELPCQFKESGITVPV